MKTQTQIFPENPLSLENETYDLIDVTSHLGPTPNSGHYISYTKHEGNWTLCDDPQFDIVSLT
jgi:ubiquitin C-terminal hydrolase